MRRTAEGLTIRDLKVHVITVAHKKVDEDGGTGVTIEDEGVIYYFKPSQPK